MARKEEQARLQQASEKAAQALVTQKSSSSVGSLSYIKKLFSYNHPRFLIATKALSCFVTHCAGSFADQQETLPMVGNEVEIPPSQLALEDAKIPPSQPALEETTAVEVAAPTEIPPSQPPLEENKAVEVAAPTEIPPTQEDTEIPPTQEDTEIPQAAVEEVPPPDFPSAPEELQPEDKKPEGPEANKPEGVVEPPLRRVEVMLPEAMAKAVEELDTEAKDCEEFRRQQLQMRAAEREQAEAARNEKKEQKKATAPKAKGKAKAKGRPRNKEGNEKVDESAAPENAPKTPEPKRRRTAAVAEDGKEKTKRAHDPAEKSEPKPKTKAARKSKAGAEEVDEPMVSEYLSFMHKYDGCVYDKAFDALFDKQLSLP